jgi:hypothetical protein
MERETKKQVEKSAAIPERTGRNRDGIGYAASDKAKAKDALKGFRVIRTRYCQRLGNYPAMVHFACAIILLRKSISLQ